MAGHADRPRDGTRVRLALQAGGRGSRMPGTGQTPKPLLPAGGTPMIERLLRQFVAAGVRTATVITGWLGDRVEKHVRDLDSLPPDLTVDFLRERDRRGNVGALAGLPRDGRTVVLSFADLVTDMDFGRLISVHRERGCDVTLTSHHEFHRVRLGELTVEGDRVVGYAEKPEKRFLICSGIAAFEPPVLDLIPRDRPVGISDLVSLALERDLSVTHWLHGSWWMDVNSADDLEAADEHLAASSDGRAS